ncbi:entericidin A/B family lipoprotein [Pelagicoccus sp. SDUM812002]|nr:entericidin A/B family lipoprotein [Pelagicoccus sp. SDUM812002]MDQ8187613.1 entericidin A/B family lipoprotein [Pelagicoccus sp. SDUM812002]
MKKSYIRIMLASVLISSMLGLVACGTVGGVGEDVEDLGEEIQDASN